MSYIWSSSPEFGKNESTVFCFLNLQKIPKTKNRNLIPELETITNDKKIKELKEPAR